MGRLKIPTRLRLNQFLRGAKMKENQVITDGGYQGYLIPQTATILALNGPPESGKDALAQVLANEVNGVVKIHPLAMSMRLAGFAMLGETYSFERYQELKKTPIVEFGGLTFREWMIRFSERFMKKIGGEIVFARLWLKQVSEFYRTNTASWDIPILWIMPDAGFQPEQFHIATEAGLAEYKLIRLAREGKDFRGDSREYVFLPRVIPQIDLTNNGTLDEAAQIALRFLKP